jgi:hypothetical protein
MEVGVGSEEDKEDKLFLDDNGVKVNDILVEVGDLGDVIDDFDGRTHGVI